MYGLSGLEAVAYERVEEYQRQADRERILRSLPRSESWLRKRGRLTVMRLLGRRESMKERQLQPVLGTSMTEVCIES